MDIKLHDDELKAWLKEKWDLVNEGRGLQKKIDEIMARQETLGLAINRVKERIVPRVYRLLEEYSNESEFRFGEYEVLDSVELEGEEIVCKTVDLLEGHLEALRERVKDLRNKEKQIAEPNFDASEAEYGSEDTYRGSEETESGVEEVGENQTEA